MRSLTPKSGPIRMRHSLTGLLGIALLCLASVFSAGCCSDDDSEDEDNSNVQITPTSFTFHENFNADYFEETYEWESSVDGSALLHVQMDDFFFGDGVIEVYDGDNDLVGRYTWWFPQGWIGIDSEWEDYVSLDNTAPGRWHVYVYVSFMDGTLDFTID